ncbi:venom protease-like [Contarinia nasturtii]|uniref:venom protease-like n=1 Tax=Contarinia nasturtii TaxID=265458 RepID=UPI0012D37B36|nr:venom protease-like [Contarinia nasturtii]
MVRLGEYNLSASHNDVVQHIKIIRSERHAMNDIAILFLERDVGISPHIRPVCLPISEPIRSRSFVEYNPFIFGWDLLRKDRKFSNIPFEQQITVLDNKSCKERYQQLGKLVSANQFDQSVVCAGHLDKFDGCISEFGSPMLQPIRNGELDFRYYQTGIAAYGIECERTDGPAVFTSVQYHIDWIQEKINS